MNQARRKTAINLLLYRIQMEIGTDPESRVVVSSPRCSIDEESYDLLVARTGGAGYQRLFTQAVQAIRTIVSIEQLPQVIAAVKKNRSGYRSKTVHTRMGKIEYKWIEEMALAMQVKPARVMEAVIFLYLRAEDQKFAEEN